MKTARPKTRRLTPQQPYSYAARGLTKISVPLPHPVNARLKKMAEAKGLSKLALAADLLATAVNS